MTYYDMSYNAMLSHGCTPSQAKTEHGSKPSSEAYHAAAGEAA